MEANPMNDPRMLDPEWPKCDICTEPMDDAMDGSENDWNGDTGNHLSCERFQKRHNDLAEVIERNQATPDQIREYKALRELLA